MFSTTEMVGLMSEAWVAAGDWKQIQAMFGGAAKEIQAVYSGMALQGSTPAGFPLKSSSVNASTMYCFITKTPSLRSCNQHRGV